jgi:hypothetical protein
MNYSEVFDVFAKQNWDNDTKLSLIMDFLDRNDYTIITPGMFEDYLLDVVLRSKANVG